MDEIVFQQVEILEPKWTPYEQAMWLAGLVPMQAISRDELRERFPSRDESE